MNSLAQHEAVVAIDEPQVGSFLGPFLSDLPGADPRALTVSTFTLRRVEAGKDSQFFAEEFQDVWLPGLARMMRERFYAQLERKAGAAPGGQRYLVIKEPNGSQSADVILRALPRSKLLFLLRDGRDVVDSELAANLEGAWVSKEFPGLGGVTDEQRLQFVVQSAQKWLWRTEVVQAALDEHPGPSRLVRYEELRAEPKRELAGILSWIGLRASDSELTAWVEKNSFKRMGSTGPQEFVRMASPGAWRQNLRPQERAVLEELLAPKLRELGYEA
jgi:hypothetical protein